jgi:hypothetical protein
MKFFGKIIIIQNSIQDTNPWNKYIYDFIIKLLISNQDPIGKFKVIV